MKKNDLVVILYFVIWAVISRLIPHPWNLTAIGGLSLFLGKFSSNKKSALIVLFLALFLSDALLNISGEGFHQTMIYVYLGFSLPIFLSRLAQGFFSTVGVVLTSAIGFFLISNFGVWISQDLYSHNLQGLLDCYAMAIPFFKYRPLADLVYYYVFTYLFSAFQSKIVYSLDRKKLQS